MCVLERMDGGIAVAVERGIVAVAPGQPVLTDGHFREIGVTEAIDHFGKERVLSGVHQVNVYVRALFKVARHIEVEIPYDVHVCFSTISRIGSTADQTDFFGAPVGKDQGTVEGIVA